jgi:anti-anti-sigma regulatory factor
MDTNSAPGAAYGSPPPAARRPLQVLPCTAPFTTVVDARIGRVQARGRLTARTAEQIRAAVRGLHRSGHSSIGVDLGGIETADADGRRAVHDLQEAIAAEGGLVTVLQAAPPTSC